MLAILSSLNAHNLPIFQPILKILVSKFMIHRALSDKTCLSLGLLSPLTVIEVQFLSRWPTITVLLVRKIASSRKTKKLSAKLLCIAILFLLQVEKYIPR